MQNKIKNENVNVGVSQFIPLATKVETIEYTSSNTKNLFLTYILRFSALYRYLTWIIPQASRKTLSNLYK